MSGHAAAALAAFEGGDLDAALKELSDLWQESRSPDVAEALERVAEKGATPKAPPGRTVADRDEAWRTEAAAVAKIRAAFASAEASRGSRARTADDFLATGTQLAAFRNALAARRIEVVHDVPDPDAVAPRARRVMEDT